MKKHKLLDTIKNILTPTKSAPQITIKQVNHHEAEVATPQIKIKERSAYQVNFHPQTSAEDLRQALTAAKTAVQAALTDLENQTAPIDCQATAVALSQVLRSQWVAAIKVSRPVWAARYTDTIVDSMAEFLPLMADKGYLDRDNLLAAAQQLALVDNFGTCGTYGDCNCVRGTVRDLNFNFDYNEMQNEAGFARHIVFHELTHLVTPDFGRTDNNRYHLMAFLRECLAEATACALDGYAARTSRTPINRDTPLTSNWRTGYNRNYQQMGDEFLQTLPWVHTPANDTDAKRFKALTKMAISPNQVMTNINDTYQGRQACLDRISQICKKVLSEHQVTAADYALFRTAIQSQTAAPEPDPQILQ